MPNPEATIISLPRQNVLSAMQSTDGALPVSDPIMIPSKDESFDLEKDRSHSTFIRTNTFVVYFIIVCAEYIGYITRWKSLIWDLHTEGHRPEAEAV